MIDGCAYIGRNPRNGRELDARALAAHLDGMGATAAVVCHYQAIFQDFRAGNAALLRAARELPGRVIPALYVSPVGFDPVSDAGYLEQCREQGARVLALPATPSYYELRLDSAPVRRLARHAASLGYVLSFGLSSPRDLDTVCERYAPWGTPLLVRWTNGGVYLNAAAMLCAIAEHPNILFDLASLTISEGVGHMAREAGSGHFFVGTAAPEDLALPHLALLAEADLAERELHDITHENLARLFSLPADRGGPATDPEYEALRRRPKIDTHRHIHSFNLIEPAARDGLAELERFHCEKTLVSSALALNYDMAAGNRETFALAEKDPRVYGLIVIDPTQVEASLAEIGRYAGHPKAAGLKTVQDLYGMSLDDPAYAAILDAPIARNLPVLAHIPGLAAAARAMPGRHFVCAHATYGRVRKFLSLPNVWFDLATSHADAAETDLARLVREAGEDRLLFGSDGPLLSPAWTLSKLCGLGLSAGVLEKILRENALEAFPRLRGNGTMRHGGPNDRL